MAEKMLFIPYWVLTSILYRHFWKNLPRCDTLFIGENLYMGKFNICVIQNQFGNFYISSEMNKDRNFCTKISISYRRWMYIYYIDFINRDWYMFQDELSKFHANLSENLLRQKWGTNITLLMQQRILNIPISSSVPVLYIQFSIRNKKIPRRKVGMESIDYFTFLRTRHTPNIPTFHSNFDQILPGHQVLNTFESLFMSLCARQLADGLTLS